MIGRYAVLAQRIRQELGDIEAVVSRVERSMAERAPGSVRNIYAFQLDADRVERLTDRLPRLFAKARAEMERFADVLDHLAHTA